MNTELDPVGDLLRDKNVKFRASSKDYVVSCFNPDHEDTNPSMNINRNTGMFNCFSCGFKGNIFNYFGILSNNTSIKVIKLKNKIKELRSNIAGLEFPDDYTPVTSFRGISKETFAKFEVFTTSLIEGLEDRVVIPIKDIRNKPVVFQGRHALSSGNPRYIFYPKNIPVPIFPQILEDRYKSIVLVEGIFDLLNLYDKGLKNVACIFGVNNLDKDTVQKMQPFKAQGVLKVYLMLDGDEAGQEAMDRVLPLVEETGLGVEKIVLEKNKDPGDLTQDEVTKILEYINEKDSTYRQMP